MLGWDQYRFHKKRARTRYAELVFFHPLGSAGHIVHSGASGARNAHTIYFMLGWAQCGFHKKRVETRYTEFVFLDLVGSAGHLVHSCVQNIDALFFMLRWASCDFHKKRAGTSYSELVFLHLVGSAGHVVQSDVSAGKRSMHYFSYSCGTGMDFTKSAPGHVTPKLCFCILYDQRVT
jgi:hypothetical protein